MRAAWLVIAACGGAAPIASPPPPPRVIAPAPCPADLGALANKHGEHGPTTCVALRSPDGWRWWLAGGIPPWELLVTPAGRVLYRHHLDRGPEAAGRELRDVRAVDFDGDGRDELALVSTVGGEVTLSNLEVTTFANPAHPQTSTVPLHLQAYGSMSCSATYRPIVAGGKTDIEVVGNCSPEDTKTTTTITYRWDGGALVPR